MSPQSAPYAVRHRIHQVQQTLATQRCFHTSFNVAQTFHCLRPGQRLLLSVAQQPNSCSSHGHLGRSALNHGRFHSASRLVNAVEAQLDCPPDDNVLGGLPIRPTVAFDENPKGNRDSPIRKQLRSWSEEQVRRRAGQCTSGGHGLVVQDEKLTNSLFLGKSYTYEEDEENESMDDEGLYDTKFNMAPGDAIELLSVVKGGSKNTILSIYIRSLGTQDLFIGEDGRWIAISAVRAKCLPICGFVDPAMFEPLTPFLPENAISRPSQKHGMIEDISTFGDIPSEIAAPLTRQLANLREETLGFRRDHISVMERVHELLAHEDRFVVKTIDDASKELFGKPFSALSPGGHIAFFYILESDPLGCQICKRTDHSFRLILTPKSLVRKFEDVRTWTREYQEVAAKGALGKDVSSSLMHNPLKAFIDKARRIIIRSRTIRSPTTVGNLGPSTLERSGLLEGEGVIAISEAGETFNECDQMIIEFIWNTYLRTPRVLFNSAAQSLASHILRALGAYPSLRLEQKTARLMLQELGVLAPWSEKADDDVVLSIPGRRNGYEANQLYEQSEQLVRELNIHSPPRVLPMADSMAHLRRESKATQIVYCIDRTSSAILDDAFSIEESSDIPGAHWLHIHITHPSAFIQRDHLFAKRAAHFGASLYTSRQSYQMFPHDVAVALSLKPGSPCLTLSTLILSTGEVVEVQMTPGKIQETVKLHPKAVDKVLGRKDVELASLTVGGHHETFELSEEQVACAAQHLDVLKKAQQICQARLERRLKEVPEPLDMEYADRNFDVWVSYAYDPNQFDRSQSRHYLGDPIIYVSSARHARPDLASRRYLIDSLVMQLMSVASEMAGLWCRQREIPAIYNGSLTKAGLSPSKLSKLERHEKRVGLRYRLSSTPLPHVLINCNQYMRFTSPLRRYSDLIGHWQIDAYLRQEGKSPNRIVGYDNTQELPFSKVQLDEYIVGNAQTMKDLDRLMGRSKRHWAHQAFFRAFHFKEAPLPDVWDLLIERSADSAAGPTEVEDSGLRGRLIPFYIHELRVLKSEEGYEKTATVGQYLPVKIELVDVEFPTIFVKAVGGPSDRPTTTQPIEIAANVTAASPQVNGEA